MNQDLYRDELQQYLPAASVFTIFGSDARLKTPAIALREFMRVLSGDLGRRVTLGYPSLDAAMRGIRPGQVCVVMARAGVGKTTLLLNIAANIIENNPYPMLFASLEMPAAEIAARLFGLSTHQTQGDIESRLNHLGIDSVVEAWARRYEPFVICDAAAISMPELGKYIGEAATMLGEQVPLVFIDYLQLIKSPGSSAYERTSFIARDLKALAKEHSCAVVVACQTSREGGTGGERVTLAMARDSGVVEEAADFLIGCWRPELTGNKGKEGELTAALLKNRHGPRDEVALHFDKGSLRITEAG